MIKTKYDGVLFDLDGTLVDSMWMWKEIDREYLARFGIPLPENLQSMIEGMSFSETAIYFKERFSLPDTLEVIKKEWNQMAWDKYSRDVPVKEGVMEFLKYCKSKHIKMGIATSNSKELAFNIAKIHGLHNYMDSIVTGCDVLKGKPSPDIYLKAASELSLQTERCLVFEDIVPGIMAGIDAGMKVCAVEDAYSVYQRDEKRQLANYYIDNFNEVYSLF